MQTIEITAHVLQQQRSRLDLARGVAARQKRSVRSGIAGLEAHQLVPAVGNRREAAVKNRAQSLHDGRKRVAEIAVLAAPEAVTRHDHPASESVFEPVQLRNGPALLG